jgi:hypothetical protein
MTVQTAKEYLENADTLDAFMFVATDEGDVEALMGYNEAEEAEISLESFLGVLLYLLSDTYEIHPAVLGHGAIGNAIERANQ